MRDFTLTLSALAEVNALLLIATIAAGLLMIRQASRSALWLAGAITALALGVGLNVLFGLGGLIPHTRLNAIGGFLLALHAVALVGFAYSHAGSALPRRARAVIVGLVALFLACFVVLIADTLVDNPDLVIWSWIVGISFVLLILIPSPVCLWAAVVEVRNGARAVRVNQPGQGRASAFWRAVAAPRDRVSRAHRAFALFMVLSTLMVLSRIGILTELPGKGVAFGLGLQTIVALVYVVVLAALYLSYAPAPAPLRARLTVLVMGAALALLMAVPYVAVGEEDVLTARGIVPPQETLRLVPEPSGGYRAETSSGDFSSDFGGAVDLSAWPDEKPDPVQIGFDFPFGEGSHDSVHFTPFGTLTFGNDPSYAIVHGDPAISPLVGWYDVREGGSLHVRRDPGRILFTWADLPVASSVSVGVEGWPTTTTMQVALDSSGAISMAYEQVSFISRSEEDWIAGGGVRGIFPTGAPRGEALRRIGVPSDQPVPNMVPPDGFAQDYGRAYEAEVTRRLLPFLWLSLAAAGLVLVGVPLALRHSVTRPLDRLLSGVRRVGEGDLAASVTVESNDEVGRLADGFNAMTASLQEANAALRAHADDLEDRVAERTTELANKNRQLEQTLDELSQAQAQLVLQEKQASLGRLTSGIAHELKNPLNFVNNFAGLSRELVGELREEVESALGRPVSDADGDLVPILADLADNAVRIEEHGHRADEIVRGMMEHARGATAPPAPADVNTVVREAIEHAQESVASDCEVETMLDPDMGEAVLSAPDMGRAIAAVITNALDACAERAETENEYTAHIAVRTERRAGYVVVTVEDNGPGLPSDDAGRFFEPFYTTRPTGTGRPGLGLSLAHDVVVGHQGEIDVAPNDVGGVRATIRVPTTLNAEPEDGGLV